MLAEDLNRRKEWLPLRPQHDCLQRRPDNNLSMRCTKNEPRESSSTSGSGLPTSSSAGRSEDAVVLFLAGFLTTLVFGRIGLTGLSCGFTGLSCDGFLFQNGSSPCQKIITISENIWTEATSDKKIIWFLQLVVCWRCRKGVVRFGHRQPPVRSVSFLQLQWLLHL